MFGNWEEPLTLHKYVYCLSDPVNYYDPSGEYVEIVLTTSNAADTYARDMAVGGLALGLAYGILAQNEAYQMALESVAIGLSNGIDSIVDFGLDVYATTRSKAAKKHIAGAMKQFQIHLGWWNQHSSNAPKDPLKHWLTEMREFVSKVRKAGSHLRGKQREGVLKEADDMWRQLEEMARERGLPWHE